MSFKSPSRDSKISRQICFIYNVVSQSNYLINNGLIDEIMRQPKNYAKLE